MVGSKETDSNELHDRDIKTTVLKKHNIECQKYNWVASGKSDINKMRVSTKEQIFKEMEIYSGAEGYNSQTGKNTLKTLNFKYQEISGRMDKNSQRLIWYKDIKEFWLIHMLFGSEKKREISRHKTYLKIQLQLWGKW